MKYWKCDLHWHCQNVYLTVVQADLTGDGVADFSVALLGTRNLKPHNFVLGSGGNDPKFADSSLN